MINSKRNPGLISALHSIRWIRRPSRSLSVDPSPDTLAGEEEGNPNSYRSGISWAVRWKYSLSLEKKGLFGETLLGEVLVNQRLSIEEYLVLFEILFLIKDSTRNFHLKRLAIALKEILNLNLNLEERSWRIITLYEASGSNLFRIRGSRKKTFLPFSRIVSIQTAPIEIQLDQKGSGIPYSSYCKGYGEGSSRGPEVTPFSAELDGEEIEPVLDPRILNLVSISICQSFVEKREKFSKERN
jgi:hypothetical protein